MFIYLLLLYNSVMGPYFTTRDGKINYKGNKLFSPLEDILSYNYPEDFEDRVKNLSTNKMWKHIAKINHSINFSANNYFSKMNALFTPLPLTTRMISSPGAVYGREAINYTTDTCPITLKWFDLPKEAFLAESSQIYLELALLQDNINHVYAMYNSFRKEKADATHLSEFHHIEYEGKVSQTKNKEIIKGLVHKIINYLLVNNEESLSHFLKNKKLKDLNNLGEGKFKEIKFSEALEYLYDDTKQDKYKSFTLKNFGSWEEIRLTEIFNGVVAISNFPLLEVPFYHAVVYNSNPAVAENTDFIWPGYREFIGSGHRVRSLSELEEKAKIFNLPKNDYLPYLESRKSNKYTQTSGFGLGWERFLQGLLEMPFIWSAVQFPRGHTNLRP